MIVEQTIQNRLEGEFAPDLLEVINESASHNVPAGSESHFRVVVVSEQFEGAGRLQRHRRVHRALADELAGPIHALAIDAWTPAEWTARSQQPGQSPDCLGGDGSLPRR